MFRVEWGVMVWGDDVEGVGVEGRRGEGVRDAMVGMVCVGSGAGPCQGCGRSRHCGRGRGGGTSADCSKGPPAWAAGSPGLGGEGSRGRWRAAEDPPVGPYGSTAR